MEFQVPVAVLVSVKTEHYYNLNNFSNYWRNPETNKILDTIQHFRVGLVKEKLLSSYKVDTNCVYSQKLSNYKKGKQIHMITKVVKI